MEQFTFTQRMQYIDYRNAIIKLQLKRIVSLPVLVLFILIVFVAFRYIFYVGNLYLGSSQIILGLLLLYLFVIYPLMVLNNIKNNFKDAIFLKEPIHFTIDSNKIYLEGQSFKYETQWQNIQRVYKINNLILLYTGKANAIYIDSKQAGDVEQLYLINLIKHIAIENDISSNLQ